MNILNNADHESPGVKPASLWFPSRTRGRGLLQSLPPLGPPSLSPQFLMGKMQVMILPQVSVLRVKQQQQRGSARSSHRVWYVKAAQLCLFLNLNGSHTLILQMRTLRPRKGSGLAKIRE